MKRSRKVHAREILLLVLLGAQDGAEAWDRVPVMAKAKSWLGYVRMASTLEPETDYYSGLAMKGQIKQLRFDWADFVAKQVMALRLPEPRREYRFQPTGRLWRFDLSWPDRKLAVEISGSEWASGRHSRGAGMAKDYTKLNAAVLDGWKVLQFTGSQVKSGEAITLLEKVLKAP